MCQVGCSDHDEHATHQIHRCNGNKCQQQSITISLWLMHSDMTSSKRASYSQQNVKCNNNKQRKTNAGYSFNINGMTGMNLSINEKAMKNTAGLMRYWPCSCAGNHMWMCQNQSQSGCVNMWLCKWLTTSCLPPSHPLLGQCKQWDGLAVARAAINIPSACSLETWSRLTDVQAG